jgi:hypothetical protein
MSIFGGFSVDQYVLFNLNKGKRKDYLSEFDWYRSRWINEPFEALLNNKIICNEVLQQYLQVPEIHMLKNKGNITCWKSEKYSTIDEAIELLIQKGALFMKPLASGKGKNVYFLRAKSNQFYMNETEVCVDEIKNLFRNQDKWFLSEPVKQHPYLDEIYEKTSNTIRIITLRDAVSGKCEIAFAVHRFGTSSTIPVDNASRGGLVSKVDLDSGMLSEAHSLQTLEKYDRHPDTHKKIEGVGIPEWEGIKSTILTVANNLPFLKMIAWDILVTENGLCVIEANTSTGVNIIQLWEPQRNSKIGTFFRMNGVIK